MDRDDQAPVPEVPEPTVPRRTPVLAARAMSHRYPGGRSALTHVDLDLSEGATALVGVNGAGKSTLFGVLSGGLRPTTGSVHLEGLDLYGRGRRSALTRIALMPQHLDLPRALTVAEVVGLIARSRGVTRGHVRQAVDTALEVTKLGDRRDDKVGALSGGMVRRVGLAQAIVGEPEILLLDEPSTGLDPEQRSHMVALVKGLGGCVLMSSHVMEDVTDVADRIIVLDGGQVVFDGDLATMLEHAPAG